MANLMGGGKEETLDPLDWDKLKLLGHTMVDDMINYLATVRQRPPWQPIPEDVKKALDEPLPTEGTSVENVYKEFLLYILPYPMGNIHPRFWGWVIGTGTPVGMFAEMLAASMNPSVGGGDHIANYIEMRVVEWCKQALDYPSEASGLLVSGCSMANLVGLTVARNHMAGFNVREQGILSTSQPLTLYGSTEMHFSIQRAVEVLGLGNRSLRQISVDAYYRVDVRALEEAILQDLSDGAKPICIIANVGTVNTGAIDPLNELAEIAHKYNLWLHTDGAFGALANLSPKLRYLLDGLNKVDSLAIDLHKWMHLPYEIGCIFVRNKEAHLRTFVVHPNYLEHTQMGNKNGPLPYLDYGLELSRSFRALKAWMSIKAYGIDKLGRIIHQNVCQAKYLADLIEKSDRLELLAPVVLNIVCFRFKKPGLNEEQLNALNKRVKSQLRNSGIAVLSSVTLNGKYALRCAITNHRSLTEDLDLLVSQVVQVGETLSTGQI